MVTGGRSSKMLFQFSSNHRSSFSLVYGPQSICHCCMTFLHVQWQNSSPVFSLPEEIIYQIVQRKRGPQPPSPMPHLEASLPYVVKLGKAKTFQAPKIQPLHFICNAHLDVVKIETTHLQTKGDRSTSMHSRLGQPIPSHDRGLRGEWRL